MRIAQVVHFRIKPDNWEKVVDLVARWQQEHAEEQTGVLDTFILKNQGSLNEGTALVVCESEEALRAFSDHPTTLEFFEEAKALLDGEPDYYHADITGTDILRTRILQ